MNVKHTISRWAPPLAVGFLAVVLLAAAVLKIDSLERFTRLTNTFQLVPPLLRPWIPIAVILSELAAACMLIAPPTRRIGLYVTTLLLTCFTIYLSVQMFNPYAPSCHCFGELLLAQDASASNRLGVVRNGLLLGLCVVGLWGQGEQVRDEPLDCTANAPTAPTASEGQA